MVNITITNKSDFTENEQRLLEAIQQGDDISSLIKQDDIDIKRQNIQTDVAPQPDSFIHYAARCGNHDAIGVLCALGVNVNATNQNGSTAVMLAAEEGHEQSIRTLKELGADVNASMPDGWTAVMIAAQNGHEQSIRTLKELGADVNATKQGGWTAVLIAAHDGHEQSLRTLTELGVDVKNASLPDGSTAVMIAANQGNGPIISFLVSEGVDETYRTHPLMVSMLFLLYQLDRNYMKENKGMKRKL